jgi:hypothetical protein
MIVVPSKRSMLYRMLPVCNKNLQGTEPLIPVEKTF